MLLIVSDKFDSHADLVQKKLEGKGVDFFRFDLDLDSLRGAFISFSDGVWRITQNGRAVTSICFDSVWCRRPFMELNIEDRVDQSNDFKIWRNEWNRTLLGLYSSIRSLRWLNSLKNSYRGENKYYQMELARSIGFNIPPTLISNDKSTLIDFARKYDFVVFKVMEQEIYQVGDQLLGLYANKITSNDLSRFSCAGENPIFLQKYIDKAYEVRYTVVDGDHHVCRIDSQASEISKDDWRRYDVAKTPYTKIDPPCEVRAMVNSLLEEMGLSFGALDFIVDEEGGWHFLEINCMGQWLWVEQLSGLDISGSIVKWALKKN
ncbi:MvdC/MvdD family ATP grasp protein [Chitinilyticum litopenaei]|uniref:MvdC/MvdD family ATP grasp protein n=1 Tax=Chitinilyticum litopenaei TaxID=1121276 RepID=UPI001185130C|nr:hypothetical protein [Chitinilyticum litopenaei]